MDPFLGAPAVTGVVDGTLVHGQEFHATEAESMSGVDLVPQGLVGVESLSEPPAQLGRYSMAGLLMSLPRSSMLMVSSFERVTQRALLGE